MVVKEIILFWTGIIYKIRVCHVRRSVYQRGHGIDTPQARGYIYTQTEEPLPKRRSSKEEQEQMVQHKEQQKCHLN